MIAYAQELKTVATQASDGFPWYAVLAIATVVAVVAGFVFLKRKRPDVAQQVTSAASNVGTSVESALHKVLDLAAAQHGTIQAQSDVIAAPAVQAVINAPTALPGAPQAVQAPITPAGAILARPMTVAGTAAGVPGRMPGYLYPGDPGYPSGGPLAVWGLPFPIPGYVPNVGNPTYKEGDRAPGPVATPEQQALINLSSNSALSQAMRAQATADLLASMNFPPGTDTSEGTPANQALARMLQANPSQV